MRDFIAVTGIGRGHRAHALSPRFCLTDYFIYGHPVYVRAAGCHACVRVVRGHTKARLRNYSSPSARPPPLPPPDSIKTPGVSDRRPPPVRYQIIRWNFYGEEGKRGNRQRKQ